MKTNLIVHPQDTSGLSLAPRPMKRKVRQGPVMLRRMVALDDLTMRKLKVLGGGNVSRGIRFAARLAYDKYQRNDLPDYHDR